MLRTFFVLIGAGDYFRLGHGTDTHVREPKRIQALLNKHVVAISAGSLHTCVVCSDGEVYAWGVLTAHCSLLISLA